MSQPGPALLVSKFRMLGLTSLRDGLGTVLGFGSVSTVTFAVAKSRANAANNPEEMLCTRNAMTAHLDRRRFHKAMDPDSIPTTGSIFSFPQGVFCWLWTTYGQVKKLHR